MFHSKFKVALHPHVSVVHVEFDENTGPGQDAEGTQDEEDKEEDDEKYFL